MKPNVKPRRIREANKPYYSIKYQEKAFLYKWMRSRDNAYLKKYENLPELILNDYQAELNETQVTFNDPFTKLERLYVIRERLQWHLHLEKKWLKFLKFTGMTATEFALLFSYYSGSSFYNSTGRVKQIKGVLGIWDKIQERWCLSRK